MHKASSRNQKPLEFYFCIGKIYNIVYQENECFIRYELSGFRIFKFQLKAKKKKPNIETNVITKNIEKRLLESGRTVEYQSNWLECARSQKGYISSLKSSQIWEPGFGRVINKKMYFSWYLVRKVPVDD